MVNVVNSGSTLWLHFIINAVNMSARNNKSTCIVSTHKYNYTITQVGVSRHKQISTYQHTQIQKHNNGLTCNCPIPEFIWTLTAVRVSIHNNLLWAVSVTGFPPCGQSNMTVVWTDSSRKCAWNRQKIMTLSILSDHYNTIQDTTENTTINYPLKNDLIISIKTERTRADLE